MNSPEFDVRADTYDADLNQALSVSGEDKDYFATRRVRWVAQCLAKLSERPSIVLDYGCGIGDTSKLLQAAFSASLVVGVDISARSLELATARNGTAQCQFMNIPDYVRLDSLDLVYCNGVFHHIPLPARGSAVEYIFARLRRGGLFSFWENNPWNPATRYIMSQCVFDHDAVTLVPPQATALLRNFGFEIVRTDYCFFFPRFLRTLRFLETKLSHFPLGAQYHILCRRPSR